jgi:hypothetical protein
MSVTNMQVQVIADLQPTIRLTKPEDMERSISSNHYQCQKKRQPIRFDSFTRFLPGLLGFRCDPLDFSLN